ncbi:MAG: biopolymer transporter ExbD [Bacteroidia bacterium]|nr:biopolymer transporter ExbD [Bacteroidia bacterium]
MADVDSGSGGGHGKKKGGPKTKKKSTRIDMTAMVDVAFLLLTFFVLTATMADSVVMELTLPPKVDPADEKDLYKKIVEDKIMTLVLDSADVVKYYVGVTEVDLKKTDFSGDGVRKAIMSHLNYGKSIGAPNCKDVNDADGCWDPIFVIKPRKTCRYKNLVDMMDELAITQAPKYAIDKFTADDSLFLEDAEKRAKEKAEAGIQ